MAGFESSAFLRRLKNNTELAPRPVPGQIRISRAVSDDAKEPNINKSTTADRHNNLIAPHRSPPRRVDDSISESNDTVVTTSSTGKYISTYRLSQFEKLLSMENVDLNALRKLAWNGIPSKYRADVWQMLLGYLPTNKDRRSAALTRKRKEYFDSISMYFTVADADRTKQDEENLGQILIDLPRTCPDIAFFQQTLVQKSMERILYVWSIRHPASGYVQGMNDLLTPLLLVCLQPFAEDPLRCDVATLDAGIMVCCDCVK